MQNYLSNTPKYNRQRSGFWLESSGAAGMKKRGKKNFPPVRISRENWEMETWLRSNEISLSRKYDLENAPRPRKKKNRKPLSVPSSPEATLDLHGMTSADAAGELKSFVLGCRLKGCYLIKIIHGKGLHSPGEAKLGRLVRDYLEGEGKNMISSWQIAPPEQGGEGAVLVFL